MTVSQARFRDAMSAFATGVTVVTALGEEGVPFGITANAVTSVSLHPPLVLVCIDRASSSHDPIVDAGAFALNVLGAGQEGLARRFSGDRHDRRFRDVEFSSRETGSPVLETALAWLDCRMWNTLGAGDHTVLFGEVADCGAEEGEPLLFFRGAFRRPRW